MIRAATLCSMLALIPGLAAADQPSSPQPQFKAGLFDPPRPAPDFELKGSNGAPIKLSQFKGKVIAIAFGFTYCPRICPTTLAKLSQAYDKLGADAKDFQIIFVSVDPERDSPERMKEFLAFFNPTFLGATGTPEELEAVRNVYGITAKKANSEIEQLGYEVHHSSFVYLIDRQGNLRLLMPFGKSADDFAHDARILLGTK